MRTTESSKPQVKNQQNEANLNPLIIEHGDVLSCNSPDARKWQNMCVVFSIHHLSWEVG